MRSSLSEQAVELLQVISTEELCRALLDRPRWQTKLAEICAEKGTWLPARVEPEPPENTR